MDKSHQDRDEAAAVAAMLNQVCNATLDALQAEENPGWRAALAAELDQLQADLDEAPGVRRFLKILIRWLRGSRPDQETVASLDGPFRRALESMLDQVPEAPVEPEISLESLLAQTTAAVVAALQRDDLETRRMLAVQLLNLGQHLPEEARPLLENFRALLGGAPVERLPPISGEPYRQLWSSARLLLTGDFELGETARAALLDRLVHNTYFALRANSPELTSALLEAFVELQRQALASGQTELADFILGLRLRLEGRETSHLVERFDEPYLSAWRRLGATTSRPSDNGNAER